MSAPEQYERRWNRTPSGCLCRASLIWQKELHFGPQTQPANKCRLFKGAIRTNTKILPQSEFTAHSIQNKYVHIQEINCKTEVYLPTICISSKQAHLKRSRARVKLLSHPYTFLLRDETTKRDNHLILCHGLTYNVRAASEWESYRSNTANVSFCLRFMLIL